MKSSSVRAGRSPLRGPRPVLFGFFSGTPAYILIGSTKCFDIQARMLGKSCALFSHLPFFVGASDQWGGRYTDLVRRPLPLSRLPLSQHDRTFPERSSQDLSRVRARLSRRFRTISEMLHERLFLLRSGFVSIPNPAASSDDAMSCRLQRVDQPR